MNRNLILTIILVFIFLLNTIIQCIDTSALGSFWQTIIAFFCNYFGRHFYVFFNEGFRLSLEVHHFCIYWIQCSTTLLIFSFVFILAQISNCNLTKVQIIIFDDFRNFKRNLDFYDEPTNGKVLETNIDYRNCPSIFERSYSYTIKKSLKILVGYIICRNLNLGGAYSSSALF